MCRLPTRRPLGRRVDKRNSVFSVALFLFCQKYTIISTTVLLLLLRSGATAALSSKNNALFRECLQKPESCRHIKITAINLLFDELPIHVFLATVLPEGGFHENKKLPTMRHCTSSDTDQSMPNLLLIKSQMPLL